MSRSVASATTTSTPEPLVEVTEWLHPFERYWRDRLSVLSTFLEESDP